MIINRYDGEYSSYTIRIVDIETGRTLRSFRGHNESIAAAVFSPDGKRVISGGRDKTVKLWDAESGQEIRSMTHGNEVFTVAFNNNGRFIASGAKDNTVKIWDTETGREIRTFKPSLRNPNDVEGASNISYSPDGKYLAVGYIYRLSFIVIWDAETGREIQRITGGEGLTLLNAGYVESIKYSSDGRKILSVCGYSVIVWDAGTGKEINIIPALDLTAANYSPNGQNIITCSTDETIRIWNSSANRKKTVMYGQEFWDGGDDPVMSFGGRHVQNIATVAFSPNGKQAAAASGKIIRIWDVATGRMIRILESPTTNKYAKVDHIVWSPDGSRIASAENGGEPAFKVAIWNVETGVILRTIRGNFSEFSDKEYKVDVLAWSPNGKMLATGSMETVKIWDADTGNPIRAFNAQEWYTTDSVSFRSDSQFLMASGRGVTKIFDVNTGRETKIDIGTYTSFSPDGKTFIAADGGNGKGWWIYDAATGKSIKPGKVLSRYISTVSYSPDGKRIIINTENSPTIYDIETTNSIVRLSGHLANVSSASYSTDGKWIITGSRDGTVRIWSAETFAEKARLISYDDGEWLAMTPDGYYNASAKGDQYLNVRQGNTVTGIDRYRAVFNKPAIVQARLSNSGRMAAHKDYITSVAVNLGGTRIASVSLDKTIKLWDLESGRELRTISGIGGSVNAVSFSPDGKTLIHGAEDKTIRIWDAETGRAIRTINGHSGYVNEARYSPDGKRIASCADEKNIKIWDAESGREIRTLSGHTDGVCVIAWSPDGKRLASGSNETEKAIRIWDAESGRVLQTIPGQGGRVMGLAYSPDGKKIASCTAEVPALKIWDAETGRQIRSIPIEDGAPYSLAWSPDGKRLAVGYIYDKSDGYMYIFNAETGAEIHDIWVGGAPQSLTWTPDGRRIITTCNFKDAWFIKVFDALSGKEL